MTTGKTIALTRQTFADKVMSLLFSTLCRFVMGFPCGSAGKESACNVGDLDSIPGLGRSPREGNDNPLQYSCLGNSMNREDWRATNYRVAKRILSKSFLKLMSIESVMPSNHLILCHPLILLPSVFPSIRVFSNESAHHKV